MLGTDHIHAVWSAFSDLRDFGHFLDAALDVNLGYSILLRLGNFSGKRIGAWVDREKLRVIPAMAETDSFDEAKFTSMLESVEKIFKRVIRIFNVFSISWAILAAIAIMIVLAITPYCSGCAIPGGLALRWEVFVAGATPVGLSVFIILHTCALYMMRKHSKECDVLIKYSRKTQQNKIKEIHAALQAKLAQARG
jgi:hypothetical protein